MNARDEDVALYGVSAITRQMMTDGGLTLPQPFAQVGDVQFVVFRQVRQDALLGWRQRYLVPGQGHHLLRVVHRQITPGDGGL